MSDVVGRIAAQVALAGLRGRRVADARRSIGTSFLINFAPVHWIARTQLPSGRWTGGYATSRSYLLAELCDWRMSIGGKAFRAKQLPVGVLTSLLQRLIGLRLFDARLTGPSANIKLRFQSGVSIVVQTGETGQWWIGRRDGTISACDIR